MYSVLYIDNIYIYRPTAVYCNAVFLHAYDPGQCFASAQSPRRPVVSDRRQLFPLANIPPCIRRRPLTVPPTRAMRGGTPVRPSVGRNCRRLGGRQGSVQVGLEGFVLARRRASAAWRRRRRRRLQYDARLRLFAACRPMPTAQTAAQSQFTIIETVL